MLQISRVFENVSKGAVAKNTDLEKCFGTTDEKKIIRMVRPVQSCAGALC